MTEPVSKREERALGWLVRSNDPAFSDWEDFTSWLEADPANADAYHRFVQAELDMLPLVSEAVTSIRPHGSLTRAPIRTRSGFAAAAASILVIGLAASLAPRLLGTDYTTPAGGRLAVAIGGADRLILNGDTRVTVSGFGKRNVRLDRGEVLFALKDKDLNPITVLVGGLELNDIGTVFNVTRDGSRTRVEVSEGAILAKGRDQVVRLSAGNRLDVTDGSTGSRARTIDRSNVGSWSGGQLAYDNEPLPIVLADLTRATGLRFRPHGAPARSFTGTLSIALVKQNPRSLEPLLGVNMTDRNGEWTVQAN